VICTMVRCPSRFTHEGGQYALVLVVTLQVAPIEVSAVFVRAGRAGLLG
jgi:hypothetical protein